MVVPLVHRVVRTIRMSLAVVATANLVVVVPQHNATGRAREAPRVELEPLVGLEILTLNAAVARAAQRTVQLVVMLVAVGEVVEDVELSGGKGTAAGAADEALLVEAAGETARRVFDGFAHNLFRAAAAAAFAGGCGSACGFATWFRIWDARWRARKPWGIQSRIANRPRVVLSCWVGQSFLDRGVDRRFGGDDVRNNRGLEGWLGRSRSTTLGLRRRWSWI